MRDQKLAGSREESKRERTLDQNAGEYSIGCFGVEDRKLDTSAVLRCAGGWYLCITYRTMASILGAYSRSFSAPRLLSLASFSFRTFMLSAHITITTSLLTFFTMYHTYMIQCGAELLWLFETLPYRV